MKIRKYERSYNKKQKGKLSKTIHITSIIISILIIVLIVTLTINYINIDDDMIDIIKDDIDGNVKDIIITDIKNKSDIDDVNDIDDVKINTKNDTDDIINKIFQQIEENKKQELEIIREPKTKFLYYVDPNMTVPNTEILESAVILAFNTWKQYNPQLEFIETNEESKADTIIEWSKYTFKRWSLHDTQPPNNGLVYCDYYHTQCIITIATGNNNCNDEYVQFDEYTIATIIMHEFGHQLELDHTTDSTHLMYGVDDILDPFDDMGYVIPPRFRSYDYYVDQYDIQQEIDILEDQKSIISELSYNRDKSYKDLLDRYNCFPALLG